MLDKLAQKLYSSGRNVVGIMKRKLNTKIRAGNRQVQSTTSKTANSISAKFPKYNNGILTWDFIANDTAIRLNTGGSLKPNAEPGNQSVPYGRFDKSKKKSAYIEALSLWAQTKYSIDEYTATRMAFAIAASANNRGQTVKAQGWLDDAKKELDKQIMGDISGILNQEINKMIMINLKY
jgi:hypothetical protein